MGFFSIFNLCVARLCLLSVSFCLSLSDATFPLHLLLCHVVVMNFMCVRVMQAAMECHVANLSVDRIGCIPNLVHKFKFSSQGWKPYIWYSREWPGVPCSCRKIRTLTDRLSKIWIKQWILSELFVQFNHCNSRQDLNSKWKYSRLTPPPQNKRENCSTLSHYLHQCGE